MSTRLAVIRTAARPCQPHQLRHLGQLPACRLQQQQQSGVVAPHPSPPATRTLSSSSTSSTVVPPRRRRATPAPDLERLRRQPAKVIPDYLTPMPSHLLTTMLDDLEACGGGSGDNAVAADTSQDDAVLAADHHPPSPSSRGPPLPKERSGPSSPIVQSPALALPQGHHLVYFPIQAAPSRLAPDGADLDHSPGLHYSRRLWAGGEVTFRGAGGLVLDGRPWTCTETIGDVRVKADASRELAEIGGNEKVFVDVWRRYALDHHHPGLEKTPLPWSIEERRTLVFMDPGDNPVPPPQTGAKVVKYPHEAAHSVRVLPSARHLFHFSALTFNAHAIHLDPQYARSVDGHRAPLVHGPLTLALMLRVLAASAGPRPVERLVYRNHAPLYVDEPLTVKVRPVPSRGGGGGGAVWDAWVEGPDGGLAVKGTATLAT
ncbi:hypothetical protein ISF_01879 [Cordyceps fumosorosea ARSEF 2679]|uniref:Uncharacterized protein n=1 Tax=Cordyceps fumosorosea (strain ARSEF 2679) TaxID=1081104 RepID=A0A168CG06_CORFA|nr:hypothetical protein ISF_01879 [Cordyceps fumosorosea ARSEF 2679]OAA71328.1 hypothetical protein ISF_01879 [Cordyceps fumosorosea ARSEF 2679]